MSDGLNPFLPVAVIDKDSKYSVNYDYTTGDAIIRVAVNHIMPSTIQQMIMDAVQAAVRNHPYYNQEIEDMVRDAFQSQIEDIVAKEVNRAIAAQVNKSKIIETTRFPPALIPPATPAPYSPPYDAVEDWPEPTDLWDDGSSSSQEFWDKIKRRYIRENKVL